MDNPMRARRYINDKKSLRWLDIDIEKWAERNNLAQIIPKLDENGSFNPLCRALPYRPETPLGIVIALSLSK